MRGLTKTGRQKSSEFAYLSLRRQIIESELAPGSQILEQELSDKLGISRTPLREALLRLQSEGLLEIIPRHGVRITPMSIKDMKEIYQVLASLESTAAAALASTAGTNLAKLDAICDTMTKLLDRDNIELWAREDESFHLTIVEMVGNKRLSDIVGNCWDQVHRLRMFTLRLQTHPQPEISTQEHRDILEAIRQGNPNRAAKLMLAHREKGKARQIETIEKYRFSQL